MFASVQNQPGRVRVCNPCHYRPGRLGDFAVEFPLGYATALALTPDPRLHSFSYFTLTTHAYGYITGQFSGHSLVHATVLNGVGHRLDLSEALQNHI
jgi:hypothetical protein